MGKHKSILGRAKAEARSIRREATIQANQTAAAGGGGIAQIFRNYISHIKGAVEESKRAKKKRQK
jgi:hypothetical protein